MRKVFLILCINIFTISIVRAQNLVSNPSFEQTRGSCNGQGVDIYIYGMCDTIYDADTSECFLKDWFIMSGTPDVYSLGSAYFKLPISDRLCKYIYPNFGNNIAGEGAFNEFDTISKVNSREIMENKLIDTLKRGHKYKLSFFVQLFDSVPLTILGLGKIMGINSFSAYFSKTVLNWQNNTPFPMGVYEPQIQIDTMVKDTQHWVLLTDTFTAKGGERYMAVGNFKPDSLIQTQLVDSVRQGLGWSYYFYDDFSLIDLTPDGVEEVGSKKLELYPNPVTNQLTVGSNRFTVNTIEITNLLGQVCIIPPCKGGKGDLLIDVSSLSNGIYFIRATDMNGNVSIGKFVKE